MSRDNPRGFVSQKFGNVDVIAFMTVTNMPFWR
jgi:hypothetical protein